MLEGIADGYRIDANRLWAYLASGWVAESRGSPRAALAGEGCTVWAASGAATRDGTPLLAKNRDYYKDHHDLQVLSDASPADGYRWLALGSVGSPGVFSSGMNERGVCVADTHVATRELGPGWPRYAQMLDVLERCATVAEAVRLLAAMPSAGGGNVVITDASGNLAACELAHGRLAVRSDAQLVVATNHFTSPVMRRRHVRLAGIHEASVARRSRVRAVLHGAGMDADAAQMLMAAHGAQREAICRHAYPSRTARYGTISSVIYLPRAGEVRVADGWPCSAPFVRLLAGRDFWRAAAPGGTE